MDAVRIDPVGAERPARDAIVFGRLVPVATLEGARAKS